MKRPRTYRIEITPSGGDAVQSRTFRIIAWDTKQYLGEFDEDDRSRVTHPLEAAVLDKDKDNRTVMVDWVDYRHFLKNQVRIYLYQVGNVRQLDLKTKLDNTGRYDWELNNRSIKACSEGSCYFVIRSGRKVNHLITSHSFTLGDVGDGGGIEITEADVGPSEDSAAAGSVLTLGWTGPEGEIRIDLYQAGYYHQTIKEEVFPVDDEGVSHLSWTIPATLPGGEDYTVVLTSLADGTKQATSTPVSIEAAEGDVAVTRPKNISLGRKSTRLGWKNTQGPVDIDLYLDGRRVKTIARNTSPTRVHSWRLPGVLAGSDQYTVRVSQADDEGVFGISAPFSISAPERVGAKQPSQKLCRAAGLEAGCTRSAIKVAQKARKRECVKFRLYGEACTKKHLSAARNQREALLASVEEMPTACGKNQEEINGVCWRVDCNQGEIRIGNQCRPESQCPGLALLDESRPENMPRYDGPKRCDQNLIQGESSGDANMAALLHYLLAEMARYKDARVNSQFAVQLFDQYHNHSDGEKNCESTQAQRFFSDSMCSEVAESDRNRKMTCIRRGDEDSICPSWGNHNEPLVRARARFFSDVMHDTKGVLAQLLGEYSGLFGDVFRGTKDFKLAFYETDSQEDSNLSEDACPQDTGVCRTKGFYWPSEPVVAPEAFDALTPAARVHAEFIWRTAKVREALFDTGRFVNADQELIPNAAHKFKLASSLDPGLYGQDYTLKVPGGGYFGTDIALRATPLSTYYEVVTAYGNGPDFWGLMGSTQNDRDGFYLHSEHLSTSTVVAGLTCAPGMGVVEGICTVCEPGTFQSVGAGSCFPCGINQFSSVGASSCALCPMNQVPQEGNGACMDNPCTEKEYWDITTRSCQKDARKRHKWVQMHFLDLTDREIKLYTQDQMYRAGVVLETYANSTRSPENDREIVWETGLYDHKGGTDGVEVYNNRAPGLNRERDADAPLSASASPFNAPLREEGLVERFGKTPELVEKATRLIHTSIKPQDRSVEWSEPAYTDLGSDQASGVRELLRRSVRHHEEAQAASGQREKAVFALHFSGHGNGFEAAGIPMKDLRTIIREELGDNRLDLVSFDTCLMANYESLVMMEGLTNWVVGHTTWAPVDGWTGDAALNLAVTEGDLKARSTRAHVGRVIKAWSDHPDRLVAGWDMRRRIWGGSTVSAYDMRKFTPFRKAFDDVLNHLADNIDRYGEDLRHEFSDNNNRSSEKGNTDTKTTVLHKFDIDHFIRTFEDGSDPTIRELAQTARRELENLVGKDEIRRLRDQRVLKDDYVANDKTSEAIEDLERKLSKTPTPYEDCIGSDDEGICRQQELEGLVSYRGNYSVLPFAWRPPLRAMGGRDYSTEADRISGISYPRDQLGKPLPGWEPLEALMRFDRAWQIYLDGEKFRIDYLGLHMFDIRTGE